MGTPRGFARGTGHEQQLNARSEMRPDTATSNADRGYESSWYDGRHAQWANSRLLNGSLDECEWRASLSRIIVIDSAPIALPKGEREPPLRPAWSLSGQNISFSIVAKFKPKRCTRRHTYTGLWEDHDGDIRRTSELKCSRRHRRHGQSFRAHRSRRRRGCCDGNRDGDEQSPIGETLRRPQTEPLAIQKKLRRRSSAVGGSMERRYRARCAVQKSGEIDGVNELGDGEVDCMEQTQVVKMVGQVSGLTGCK
ncbi:hypothetical protein DENSPDRAFT_853078 [Dentipellis sp. KUC8613]|nr:hypothetical protein DENSPDRAFT_853078 [Dentipellis sp. KUC8613]